MAWLWQLGRRGGAGSPLGPTVKKVIDNRNSVRQRSFKKKHEIVRSVS